MLEHPDDPRKEPARRLAERKWRNHATEKAFKAAQKEAAEKAAKEPKHIEPANVIESDKVKSGSLVRAQTKFAKDIKAMMEGHTSRITAMYALSLEAKRKRLLVEKLRRLRLAQQDQGESNV